LKTEIIACAAFLVVAALILGGPAASVVGRNQRGARGLLGPEVLVSANEDGGELRCEPSVAAFGNTIVASWNDSYGGHHSAPGGTAVAWAISMDRGKTYSFGGYLPQKTEAALPSGGDSTVLADGRGDFLLLMLNYQEQNQDLLLYEMERSHPGQWMLRSRFPNTKAQVDRPSMSLDEQGRLWVTYTTVDNERQQQIALIHSRDLGRSWDGPILVSSGPGAKVPSWVAARQVEQRDTNYSNRYSMRRDRYSSYSQRQDNR
jgi:hypothetical protein